MADEKDGAKKPGAAAGRRARHSARAKEPVTIDLEPAKKDPDAKPADAKAAGAKSTPAKAAGTKKPAAKTAAANQAAAAKASTGSSKASPTKEPAKPQPDAKPATATKPTEPVKADASATEPKKIEPAKAEPVKTAATPSVKAASKTEPQIDPQIGPKTEPKTDPKPVAKPAEAKKAPSPSPTPPSSAATKAPARETGGAGFGSLLAAALVGGGIALGGAWLLGAFEDDTSGIEGLRAQIDQRIAAVESTIPQAPDDALSRADVDAAIQAALADRASDGNPVEPDPRIATLSDEVTATRERLDALQQSIAAAGTGKGGAADGTALAALAAQVAELDGRVSGAASAPTSEDIQAIADQAAAGRVATLEGGLDDRIRQGATGAATDVTQSALAPVEERLSALDTKLTELSSSVTERVAAVETGLDTKIETGLGELRSSVEGLSGEVQSQAQAAAEARAAQDERLNAMAEQVADTDPERRAATALALANLRTRIDDGEGYETELALVRRTNPKIDLAALDANAASGIATLASLQGRFDETADAIREAVRPAPQAGVDGLLSSLKSVVKIKRLDGEPGGDLDATLGAIRAALDAGDLAGADTAWQTLPEAGQTASGDWHDALVARMKAKNFLSQALASLLEETGG